MVVLSHDTAAFAKMKESSKKKSEGQNAKNINMKKTCIRSRNHAKASQISQMSGEPACYTETDSVTTGHEKRYLHQICSQQDIRKEVLPDTYASKHSAGTILIEKGYFN